MKAQILIAIILLGTIISVSALTIYSGECESLIFPNIEPVNWSVEGNSSDMYGFTYNKTGANITYCFHPLYKPDNFTITFYNYEEVIVDDSPPPSGGGGSCRYNKDFNWNCSEWSECSNSEQTRTCKEWNNCHNTYGRPNVTQSCSVVGRTIEPEPGIEDPIVEEPIEEPETFYNKYRAFIWLIIGIILIILTILIRIKTKKLKAKQKK